MAHPRSHLRTFAWSLSLLCLLAQLLVAAAPLWHHHDDGDDCGADCSVCVAVLSSQTGDVPAPPLVVFVPPVVVEILQERGEARGAQAVLGLYQARGPPPTAARQPPGTSALGPCARATPQPQN